MSSKIQELDPQADSNAHVGDPVCLANLAFHWARYVFHSFNRKGKDPDKDEGELDVILNLYRTEFEHVANGRFCPQA